MYFQLLESQVLSTQGQADVKLHRLTAVLHDGAVRDWPLIHFLQHNLRRRTVAVLARAPQLAMIGHGMLTWCMQCTSIVEYINVSVQYDV